MLIIRKITFITGIILSLIATNPSEAGLLIDYDGSVNPNDASLANPFSFVVFNGTSYNTNNDQLSLTTANNAGIWFGNGNAVGQPTNWSVADSATGNYLKIVTKLSPGATVWSAYLTDGTSYANFTFHYSEFAYSTGSGGSYNEVTNALDMVSGFHTFEFLLKDGNVTYRLDESQVLYSGEAYSTSQQGLMVIGDGSGSTASGIGSMIFDQVTYQTDPTFSIPEPSSIALIGLFGGSIFAARRLFRI